MRADLGFGAAVSLTSVGGIAVDAAPVIARGHNVAVVLPPVPEVLPPFLEATPKRPLLVLAPETDIAVRIAEAMGGACGVSGLDRAAKRLAPAPPPVVCASLADALALLRRSALRPAAFAGLVLAWLDDPDEEGQAALEAVMAEADRAAQRLVVTARPGPAVDRLVERYAFRAMTYGFPPVERPEGWAPPASVGGALFVVGKSSRLGELRREVLDALRPERAEDVVVAACPGSREAAADLAARAAPGQPVIVAEPWQLPWLRGVFSPFAALPLPSLARAAERKAEALQEKLARTAEAGGLDRELLLLAPLLGRFDGATLAAAALRLGQAGAPPRAEAAAPAAGPARIWVGIGRKDNVRPGDLVGALANEAKVPAGAIGRIEVRDLFCLVEVQAEHAETAVRGLTGVTLRGRRLVAHVDRGPGGGRPARR